MRLCIFGGKGGAGKTTCAAAAALAAAEEGRRVLVVSTDPAHSLGDALAKRLAPEPRRIPTWRGELWAAELAAGPAIARWTAEHRQAVRTLAERGTYLELEDVDHLLDLTLPGGDELIAWLEIDRLARETGCEEVVVDTAPTAHTLRLLASPDTLRRFAALLDRLDGRHRELATHFGTWRPDSASSLIADLEAEGRNLEERLRDPSATTLTWVLLPEALALAETRDALAVLEAAGIPVRDLIVNRVLGTEDDRPLNRERRRAEARALREIRNAFADREIRFLTEMAAEPRGRKALRRLSLEGANLTNHPNGLPPNVETPSRVPRGASPTKDSAPKEPGRSGAVCPEPDSFDSENPAAFRRSSGSVGFTLRGDAPRGTREGVSTLGGRPSRGRGRSRLPFLDHLAPPGLRLLFFGGKGGVGKTTCSAAVALALARRRKGLRILLLSTDPAHSLADVLRIPLGSDERSLKAGFVLRELDARGEFARWRARHGGEVDRAVGAFAAEGSGVEDLLDLTPPGLDELIAVSSLLDAIFGEAGEPVHDLVIVDTAPTGHALRLLEMPELALSWDRFLLSLLLKYREAVGLGDLAAGLVDLSRSLKRLQALLHDPDRTRFVVVTRAGELPRRETERLLTSLRKLGIAVPAVVINAVAPPGHGGAIRFPKRRCAIIEAPATFPPPRGARNLASWVQDWTMTS